LAGGDMQLSIDKKWNEMKGLDCTLYPFEYAPLESLKFICTNINLQRSYRITNKVRGNCDINNKQFD